MLLKTQSDAAVCKRVADEMWARGVWQIPGGANERRVWRVSPEPFALDPELVTLLHRLGPALLAFYRAANSLYLRGLFSWVNEYLDIGKPESTVEHSHMNYQKRRLPGIIRPDVILTEDGPKITELDSVPGGMGQLDAMSTAYGEAGFDILGGSRGMIDGFDAMLRDAAGIDDPAVAIVVSDESAGYLAEMSWIASELRRRGRRVWSVRPEELTFTEDGLFLEGVHLDVLYRFFELFDLKNIPKSELVAYAAKKRQVVVTPPYKHHMEEKSLLALLHHPGLGEFWVSELGAEQFALMKQVVPNTWILDPRPVPPHAEISGFTFRGKPVRDWRVIGEGTQKERRLVIKPSGFSPLAWGGHGVVIGHDVSGDEWSAALDRAFSGFWSLPYVLQRFHEGKKVQVRYFDQSSESVVESKGRVRLSPYYYVTGGEASLAGALATVVPPDKKLIHGMVDAVMAPCMVKGDA